MEQIDYITARTNPGPGVVHQAVADAARRWTLDPRGEAQGQISNLATVRARLQRAAQGPLSEDGQSDLLSTAAAAAMRRLHTGQSESLTAGGTTALEGKGTTTQELPPLEVWRQLANSLDSRLTAGDDWMVLARAISEAATAGYDVTRELPHLAAGGELSIEHPATELAYRLRAATQTTTDIEPTLGPDPKQAVVSSAARSQVGTRPSRRDPDQPTR